MGKLSDSVEFMIGDDDAKIWLNNSHIDNIAVEFDDEGKKTLIFTTTAEGKTLLQNATTENTGKPLSIIADHYLLFSPIITTPITDGGLIFDGEYNTYKDFVYLYNYLTGAEDLMTGVAPPDELISEEAAKESVFRRAVVTVAVVTQLSMELKIDPDFFVWIYSINFTANGKTYTAEVNAHTGGITKFLFV